MKTISNYQLTETDNAGLIFITDKDLSWMNWDEVVFTAGKSTICLEGGGEEIEFTSVEDFYISQIKNDGFINLMFLYGGVLNGYRVDLIP